MTSLGVLGDRVDVEAGIVVGAQRAGVLRRRPVVVEQVRGGEDRVVRVLDVPAIGVDAPGRGDELHRSLGTRDAVALHAAEFGLDEVDRRQIVPGDPVALVRLAIEGDEVGERRRGADLEVPLTGAV
jgi:hypothetical protein